ncbi:MAG: PAS domain-containing protein [Gemmatimonadaceae bacterium]
MRALVNPGEHARAGDRRNAIEEIRRVADTLQESEQRLREMIDGIPAFIYTMAPTGEPEFFNRPYLEYFGRTAEEMMDWATIGVIHPDDLAQATAIWQNAVATGQDYSLEFRLRRADGVFRWFELRSRSVHDAGGRIVRSYGLLTDIDDRRRAEDERRSSEQNLRTVLDALPGLAIVLDATGEIELVNRRVLEYCGTSFEALRDGSRSDVVHPDDLVVAEARWQRALETGDQAEAAIRLRRADGVYRWFQSHSAPLHDGAGRVVRWSTLLTDIEESEREQDALRASARAMREIVDRVPGLVYTMTPEGEVELVNRRILEYFGRTLDELKPWAITDAVHADDLPRIVAAWRRAVETGAEYQVEQRLRRADGAYRWFRGRSLPVRDAGGTVTRWYGLLTDIDDEKRAQRRLRRAMRARYEAVLAERMRIAREMHDGLLQDISGLALQLGAALPHVRTAPEAAAGRLGHVLDEAQRVNRVARDAVLGMRAQGDAGDLVSAVHAEVQRLTTLGRLALSVRVSGPARLVPSAVRDAAVSIVQEAVTNVLKHASARGVRVSIDFGSTRIRVSVRDDGGGMNPPSDTAHLATQFGLVGMRERATSIGAELRVSSAPGRGTSVRLAVPLADDTRTQTTL